MSSTPPTLGNRGSVPEATSVLLFALVAVLLWYALVRTSGEVRAGEPGVGTHASERAAPGSDARIPVETGASSALGLQRP